MTLLPGVRAHDTTTDRLTMRWYDYGPEDGVPVVLVQGNLSTGRFYEHVMPSLHAGRPTRLIAPDMRGFGRTDKLPIDATRGLRDWSDDLASLLRAIGIDRPVHLVGWSAGALAISHYAMEHGGVASLTYLCPVSPYGYGGTHRDGRPCLSDYAGTGAGGANPELVQRLRDGDTSADAPFSIRNVINGLYWNPAFRNPQHREDLLVEEILMTSIGDGVYPGDAATSTNWPGLAPGTTGMLNALSPKYVDLSGFAAISPRPPVLWIRGADDQIVSDTSFFDFGFLGKVGAVPGWPGDDVVPPQPMVSQTRHVLDAYARNGGRVREDVFESCGHSPHLEHEARFLAALRNFVAEAARG